MSEKVTQPIVLEWCPGPESNRHARNERGILSPLRLPISPPGQGRNFGRKNKRRSIAATTLKKQPTDLINLW